ncbi:MAG: hypothetical protein NXI31_24535 [bacterium]|nr:hypothetical protein [bacterium]
MERGDAAAPDPTAQPVAGLLATPLRRGPTVAAVVTAALGLTLVIAAFGPGLMSFDSFQQLEQARTGRYSDFHPPLMAFVWRGLEHLIEGPQPMLLAHGIVFFAGLALLARSALNRVWSAALAIAFVTLMPPVLANLGTIWKDIGLLATLTLATSAILTAARGRSLGWLLAALPALFYANAIRHNAAAAVLPLTLWWGLVLGSQRSWQRARSGLLLGAALFVLLQALTAITNDRLLGDNRDYPTQTLLLYDLAGISVRTGENVLPAAVTREPGFDVAARYSPKWGSHPLFHWRSDYVVREPDGIPRLTLVEDAAGLRGLAGAWFDAIVAHPGAWLAHRAELSTWQLGMHEGPVAYPYHDRIEPNTLGLTFEPNFVTDAVRSCRDPLRDSVLFRAWFWMLALTAGLATAIWRRRRGGSRSAATTNAAIATATSGLCYALPLPLCSVASDFRLVLWTVVAALLTTVLVCARAPR